MGDWYEPWRLVWPLAAHYTGSPQGCVLSPPLHSADPLLQTSSTVVGLISNKTDFRSKVSCLPFKYSKKEILPKCREEKNMLPAHPSKNDAVVERVGRTVMTQRTSPRLSTSQHWPRKPTSSVAFSASWKMLEPQPPSCSPSTEAPSREYHCVVWC